MWSRGNAVTRYDRSAGQTRDVQVYPRFFSGEPASALSERWQWTYPIAFAPKDPKRLYGQYPHCRSAPFMLSFLPSSGCDWL